MKSYSFLLLILIALITSCAHPNDLEGQINSQRHSSFDGYWFQSKAEISSYKLYQARYGELHEGEAALIFVTEPFNTKKLVKSDNGVGKNVESVLKLNQTRKFNTGIYQYSTMTSSFTPIEKTTGGSKFKITNSIQEWCGQTFLQMNKIGNQYDIKGNSYFESEGDNRSQVKSSLAEDELFSIIRINPELLPLNDIKIFPSTVYLRMMHVDMKVYQAVASKIKVEWENNSVIAYTIKYKNIDRTLTIYYSDTFPFQIKGWEESYKSYSGKPVKTKAVQKEQLMIDYWNRNKVVDSTYYQQLFNF